MKRRIMTVTASPARQTGAALLVSLVILLVLTVLGLSSLQGTSLQERMVSSQRDAQIALEGAEAALQAAEAVLSGGTLPTMVANKGLYAASESKKVPTDLLNPKTWEAPTEGGGHGNGTRQAPMPEDENGNDLLAVEPRYFIEETAATGSASSGGFSLGTGGTGDGVQQSSGDGKVFRVVAFSSGASGQAARVIEAYIVRPQ